MTPKNATLTSLTFNVGGKEADDCHSEGQDKQGLVHHVRYVIIDVVKGLD